MLEVFMKFNLKIGSFKSSFSIPDTDLAFWYIFYSESALDDRNPRKIISVASEFFKICLQKWNFKTARGVTTFLQECMLKSILEKSEYIRFNNLRSLLMKNAGISKVVQPEDRGEKSMPMSRAIKREEQSKKLKSLKILQQAKKIQKV